MEKIHKLKEMYLDKELQTVNENPTTLRTTSSYQYDHFYLSSPKNLTELSYHHSLFLPKPNHSRHDLEKSRTSFNLFGQKVSETSESLG
jgi:hypothetical protein